MKTISFTYTVSCPDIDPETALGSALFQEWIQNVDSSLTIESIDFQSVDVIKRKGADHVLFIKLQAIARDGEGRRLPGIVFLRGRSIAILPIIVSGSLEYTVLVDQPRFAIGRSSFLELPAGMADGSTDETAVARKELAEETGIDLPEERFVNLTRLLYDDRYPSIYASPGACDEGISIFACRLHMTEADLESLAARSAGAVNESEYTSLRIVRLEDLPITSPDAIVHSAFLHHHILKQKGKLPWTRLSKNG